MNSRAATQSALIVLEELKKRKLLTRVVPTLVFDAIVDRLENVHPPCGEEIPEGLLL